MPRFLTVLSRVGSADFAECCTVGSDFEGIVGAQGGGLVGLTESELLKVQTNLAGSEKLGPSRGVAGLGV